MFSKRLRELREKTGLNQKDFAKKINMPYTTYNGYEIGKREPDFDTVRLFADYFDVSMDYLLGKIDVEDGVKVDEIPQELKDLGVEYYVVAKDAKEQGISADDLRKMIKAIKAMQEG